MSRVRLLPIVIAGAAGLFILKAGELLLTETSPAKTQPTREEDLPAFMRVLTRMRTNPTPADPITTGSTGATPPAAQGSAPADAIPRAGMPASERAILERLAERRGAMEERRRELDLREEMLRAAEQRMEEQAAQLRGEAERAAEQSRGAEAEHARRLKALVTMYEGMRPKDAARIFDRLDHKVLIPLVDSMNPRKMAEVLAVMSPEAAERLTVALALRGGAPEAKPAPSADPPGELPRLDRPARPAPARARNP